MHLRKGSVLGGVIILAGVVVLGVVWSFLSLGREGGTELALPIERGKEAATTYLSGILASDVLSSVSKETKIAPDSLPPASSLPPVSNEDVPPASSLSPVSNEGVPSTRPPLDTSFGTLTASPNPCVITEGQTKCQTTLTWNTKGASFVQIWRTDHTPFQVLCTDKKSGSIVRDVSSVPKTFALYGTSACNTSINTLRPRASVTVSATTTPIIEEEDETACDDEEKPLMINGEVIACVAIGESEELEAREYSYPSELPPRVIVKEGSKRQYLLTTSFSDVCHSNANYLNQSVYFSDCDTVLTEDLTTSVSPTGDVFYETEPDDEAPWRRSYSGITTALVSKDKVVGVGHGENQNIRRGNQTYLNTIKDIVDPSCVGAYNEDGVWENCWTQFSSFANIVWWDKDDFINGEVPHELGPAIWNHRSYAQSGGGPYHPTLFKNDTHFYLYASISPSWGWGCITAARANIKTNGLPGVFKTLAADGTFSQAGRPAGYSVSSIRDFYDVTVAEPACLFDATYSGTWFNVARITGTPYYLSLEERYLPTNKAQIVLRLSEDAGDWNDSSEVMLEERTGGWGVLEHTYPMFSDANATGIGSVDANGFFVIGNNPSGGYDLNALELGLSFVD